MTYMTLNDANRIGVQSIDGEHGALMDLISQIHEGLRAHTAQYELHQAFQRLSDCALTHFWHEERQFVGTGYPDAALHTRQHEHLTMVLSCFERGVDRMGRPVSVEDQVDFLRDWLLDHIANEDRQFGDYLTAQQWRAAPAIALPGGATRSSTNLHLRRIVQNS